MYGITRKNEVYVHTLQYICQYLIDFKDSAPKRFVFIV